MLRQAVRGARKYQHVARRGSRAFALVAPRFLHYGGMKDKINFFEKTTPGSKHIRQIDPEAEDRAELEEVEAELAKINKDLEILQEGPFGPNSPFIRGLPEKERAIALEVIRKHEAEHGSRKSKLKLDDVFGDDLDTMLEEEFRGMAEEGENWYKNVDNKDSRRKVPRKSYEITPAETEHRPYVEKFNENLRFIANGTSDEARAQEVWKWYRRCKRIIPGFLRSIPADAWTLLWDSQAQESLPGAQVATHIKTLAEDATSIGFPLSTRRIISYIEALHVMGRVGIALEKWEAHQAGLCQTKEDLEAYWILGVQLFSAEGNPQRAQDIALAFLANDSSREPRILIPIITAWAEQPGKEAETKAWALYLQLRAFRDHQMTMNDYDTISIGLLKAGKLDLAIAVFKDMMVTGRDPAHDSTALYKAALGLAGNLQASSVSEQDVNRVSLSTLTLLPRRFQNRFFYASWMKKLIGMGEVDSAALVVELMYERGITPDTKHLNGIVAAWLRDGDAVSREKAERLGWAMVQRRIDSAWARIMVVGEAPKVDINQKQDMDRARMPKFMQRSMPSATIETFSILLLHYTRRSDEDMVKYLIKCLGDARLQPNSYFMNHLLYAELRKENIQALWRKYKSLSTVTQPDLETFACLWDCGKLQYDRSRTAFVADFPSARGLFSEMMRWFAQLPNRGQSLAREEFSKEFYDQIIRCFCLSKDLHGTLVALHALRAMFGFAPDATTVRAIVLQVARMAGVPANTPKRRLRRLSSTPRSKDNVAHVQRLVQMLTDRKNAALEARGQNLEGLEPDEQEQFLLEIMAELLRAVMNRTAQHPTRVEADIVTVAEEMAVSGIDLGSALDGDSQLF
ncbi:pentatricopeptide repeat protein [Aspergillus saccharolyticus JOP 1030-1]|uniref:Pentatricopeptide repeat protein n=1 Tax=Aspergillus saccharolyticus JOP 1030-1 TaxID=1450539 RepID=A0A319A3F2_9EURO|nr:pentatricopeptide repeat protein [Aspergillus saccharolyticus JOP 1030-1]PYH46668.1 pentatricopeptide repeat protein [Aspergillus saccharolyticus JOP 1030-1]